MSFEKLVSKRSAAGCVVAAVLILACSSGPAWGIEPKQGSPLSDREFRLAELDIDALYVTPVGLRADARTEAFADLAALGAPVAASKLDARSGRWALLTPVEPLIPGSGVGNELSWESLGFATPTDDASLRAAVDQAFRAYLERSAGALRLDLSEIPRVARVTVHEGGRIAHVYQPRVVNGVPVRGSYLTAAINSGNLALFGAEKWGDVDVSTRPSITQEVAGEVVASFAQPYTVAASWDKTELILVPLARGAKPNPSAIGRGYTYRLVWAVRVSLDGDAGRWEALVDAQSGEMIAFEDTNRYAEVKGGVYPVTNDGIVPDGVEQLGWPMPYQDISTTGGTLTTDTGGNIAATGSMTATFFGPYVNINDNCGADSLTQTDNIDWGGSGGTDCVTPGFGGAGNTHASRTGFYELNKIIEMARGQLPSNSWLQGRLTSNMNINQTCNAFWNGTVNFYRSGGGCFNTGEIAGVFDHEWGHGLDDNDAVPTIASPSGEGIADIYTSLRLNDSCIGRNFRSTVCTGFGDPCLSCTGVRDIDYAKRQSGQPHDYTWSNANCGGSVHCVGGVYSEAVWSLWKRKLQAAPYNYDNNTAHEIVNRLTYIGAGNVGTWFSGGPPNGGCGATSGYQQYLLADDDNGNLNDGTPHMAAIYDAFNDQEIACATPTVQDSGCAGVPTAQPVVATNPGNQQIGLTWTSVAGASSYEVFRTESPFTGAQACDFGKVKIGSTAGTSWNDSSLQNGRDYSYVVIPKSAAACFGPASACATDQPVGQPDFTVSCAPSSLAISQGDNDTATCTVISSFGYTGNVGLSCAGNPSGVSCSFAPSSVSPPANGSVNSTLTLTVSGGQATGTFAFDVEGDDGTTTRTAGMSVQVIPAGSNGPQDAVYDAGLGAPKCAVAGSSCDSTTLLDSRDSLSPGEPNQPNTLDVCNDGTSGSYHNDESNDRIVVSTLDGGNFTEGDTIEIAATVFAWSTGSADTADFYFAADANNPTWNLITSTVTPTGGTQTLTAQYVLPAGGMQAVRVQFRYQSTNAACSAGAYNDRDDLVFTVEAAGGCTLDSECDDGAFCNGAETCNVGTGQCQAGTPVACGDGVSCTVDSCNETTDACDNTPDDGLCDNGQFCDGAETCDAVSDCQTGTPVACGDGVGCTVDSCNETTDACDNTPDDGQCDNGTFCDGAETCDAVSDCQPGTPPSCDDGVGCTDDSCNAGTDACDNVANNANCDNGQFCDGAETCDAVSDCQAGADPCVGLICDENADVCVACVVDADCDNGVFCDGAESCNAGVCQSGTAPTCDDGVSCTVDSCNLGTDSCDNVPTDSLCDNGQFCDGTETCDAVLDCQAGSDPCPGQSCDEGADICVGGSGPVIWMSFRSNTAVPGVGTVADEDIVTYDETFGTWTLQFDGSDVGLGGLEIDGLALLPDGDLLLSFTAAGTVGGLSVDDSDIVRFTPTSMGSSTAGTFSVYFDGSDVGLTRSSEDVDSIALAADGRIMVSTTGGFSGSGASGADEDLFLFTGTLGTSTSGSFSKYFDGSDVGLGGSGRRDVDAAGFTSGGDLALSIVADSTIGSLAVADEDVLDFTGTVQDPTSGSFSIRQNLSTLGIASGEDIGSLHVID